jgi:hypothetical protein
MFLSDYVSFLVFSLSFCRCFEVLGFDIMLDSNLNPWLIEVNHLPSFGTDSPLDKDIKDRLMRQVFSVLPVMSDDQAAYNAFHKAESERRLNAHKAAKEKEIQLLKEKPKPGGNQLSGKPKNTSLFPPKRDSSVERDSPLYSSQSQQQQQQQQLDRNNEELNHDENQQREDPQDGNEEEQQDQQNLYENSLDGNDEQQQLENGNESVYPQDPTENNQLSSQTGTDDMLEIIDEECTPERLEEIKEILKDIYEKKSPEKMNKIDRLLAKYTGHEEEFLLFVFSKYNISSNEYEKSKPKSIRDAAVARSLGIAGVASSSSSSSSDQLHQHINGKTSPDNATVMTENTKKPGNGSNNNKLDAKRHSRSVSPPRSQGPRRIVPTWKSSISDEDTSLKSEIFTTHIPTEEDEWMKLEVSKLSQFTRIFPPEPRSSSGDSNKFSNDEELFAEKEEQEENEDENEGGASGQPEEKAKKEKETVKVNKTASYEDIIFKVFLEDRRATYRRTRPLPHRAKPEEGGFLPPLDPPPTSRSSFSSMVSVLSLFPFFSFSDFILLFSCG